MSTTGIVKLRKKLRFVNKAKSIEKNHFASVEIICSETENFVCPEERGNKFENCFNAIRDILGNPGTRIF